MGRLHRKANALLLNQTRNEGERKLNEHLNEVAREENKRVGSFFNRESDLTGLPSKATQLQKKKRRR